jgi:hypothetical protein
MEWKDPVTKLIEVVAQGIGAVARPWMVKRDARAEADRLLILAEAGTRVAGALTAGGETDGVQSGEVNLDIDGRVKARLTFQEHKRQTNIEDVVTQARALLPSQVADEPVDADWIARFFSYVQDVSNEKMRQVWSRILASEVEAPGAFSQRTLDVARNLTAEEARLLEEMAQHTCWFDERALLPQVSTLMEAARRLTDAGLMIGERVWGLAGPEQMSAWSHADQLIIFRGKGNSSMGFSYRIGANLFSAAGEQLLRLIPKAGVPSRVLLDSLHRDYGRHFTFLFGADPSTAVPFAEILADPTP